MSGLSESDGIYFMNQNTRLILTNQRLEEENISLKKEVANLKAKLEAWKLEEVFIGMKEEIANLKAKIEKTHQFEEALLRRTKVDVHKARVVLSDFESLKAELKGRIEGRRKEMTPREIEEKEYRQKLNRYQL